MASKLDPREKTVSVWCEDCNTWVNTDCTLSFECPKKDDHEEENENDE